MKGRRMASGKSKGRAAQPSAEVVQKREQQQEERIGEEDAAVFALARQPSIYSLTLDEIQNAVCEPGKSFGSMNMDEFINNIWSVEENQANASAYANANAADGPGHQPPQPLHRQGSLTLPAPLCRKTVDEVWAEIHLQQQQPLHQPNHNTSSNATRQPTFGEMTLEDFLIKAGVVREGYSTCMPSSHQDSSALHPNLQHHPQQYGMPGFSVGPAEGLAFGRVMGVGYGDHHGGVVVGDGVPSYVVAGNGKCYGGGGMVGNGYGAQAAAVGSPMSPGCSDGQVDNSGGYTEMGGRGGRKRVLDGSVEKVVERRQRRMIKNRESAARSRARKQAYTVELEVELNLLKEENARLKEEERRKQAMRRQMILESMDQKAKENAEKTACNLRRCSSCAW